MIPQIRITQPPARPVVIMGDECARLIQTAQQVKDKGHLTAQRITKLSGIRYFVQLHSATSKRTGETWHVAAYHADAPRGHVRQVVITPDGKTWTLCPETRTDRARCIHSQNKYRAHLWRISQEGRAAQ